MSSIFTTHKHTICSIYIFNCIFIGPVHGLLKDHCMLNVDLTIQEAISS